MAREQGSGVGHLFEAVTLDGGYRLPGASRPSTVAAVRKGELGASTRW